MERPAHSQDPLAPRLDSQLRLVNDWLKFAETKNVGIVGLASGGLSVLLIAVGFLADDGLIHPPASLLLMLGGALLASSLLVGVWSFLPATSIPPWMRRDIRPPHPDDNLFHFGDLSRYDPAALVAAIAERYEAGAETPVSRLHTDLAAQVIVNARITIQKLRLFRWSVILFGTGVLLGAAGILLDLRG